MPPPCGGCRRPGCNLCERYQTDPRFRKLWGPPVNLVHPPGCPDGVPARLVAVCKVNVARCGCKQSRMFGMIWDGSRRWTGARREEAQDKPPMFAFYFDEGAGEFRLDVRGRPVRGKLSPGGFFEWKPERPVDLGNGTLPFELVVVEE